MTNKYINIALVVITVSLLSLLTLYVRVGATADSIAVLRTDGMTCSSCSGKIENALQGVRGVAATEVDVQGGWVVVGYDTKTIKPEILAEKVNNAGFASGVYKILTPEQFRQITGREIGQKAASTPGCCGQGGCSSKKRS